MGLVGKVLEVSGVVPERVIFLGEKEEMNSFLIHCIVFIVSVMTSEANRTRRQVFY